MLSDRPYMRDDYQRERTSFLIWLLSATVAGFVVQNIFTVFLNRPGFTDLVGVSANAIRSGYVWTLVTYPFFHAGILSLLVGVLSTFFLGKEIIIHLGERKMMWLTLAATVAGGLLWFATNFNRPGLLIGGTPIVLCYLILFACMFPNREISFLVFFVLPVRTRPKYIAWIALGISIFCLAFYEIPGGGYAHSANLGGMLVAWLYYRYVHEGSWFSGSSVEVELPRWMKRNKKAAPTLPAVAAQQPSSREVLRAEVDRILDKINSHGFGALTPEEKRKLDDAKDMLSRR